MIHSSSTMNKQRFRSPSKPMMMLVLINSSLHHSDTVLMSFTLCCDHTSFPHRDSPFHIKLKSMARVVRTDFGLTFSSEMKTDQQCNRRELKKNKIKIKIEWKGRREEEGRRKKEEGRRMSGKEGSGGVLDEKKSAAELAGL